MQLPMSLAETPPRTSASRRCAFIDGFSLHADTSVAAGDRPALERLVRYLLRPVLENAGAIFRSSTEQHGGHCADGELGPRGPNDEVPSYKLLSNDGWHVTRDEAALLHRRMAAALDRGMEIDANGYRYCLRPESTDKDDLITLTWLRQLAAFFEVASEHHGFEVW